MKAWLNGFFLGECDDLAIFYCKVSPHSPITSGLFFGWRGGSRLHRKKLMYKTFYQRPVFRNQWSTFDAFTVMDCSQVGEKWHFFTSQVSTPGDLDLKRFLFKFSILTILVCTIPLSNLFHMSSKYFLLKFSFSEKATKVWHNLTQGFDVTK